MSGRMSVANARMVVSLRHLVTVGAKERRTGASRVLLRVSAYHRLASVGWLVGGWTGGAAAGVSRPPVVAGCCVPPAPNAASRAIGRASGPVPRSRPPGAPPTPAADSTGVRPLSSCQGAGQACKTSSSPSRSRAIGGNRISPNSIPPMTPNTAPISKPDRNCIVTKNSIEQVLPVPFVASQSTTAVRTGGSKQAPPVVLSPLAPQMVACARLLARMTVFGLKALWLREPVLERGCVSIGKLTKIVGLARKREGGRYAHLLRDYSASAGASTTRGGRF
jgi:hypothetical protein